MEIRTCEEYVLEELKAAQREVERLRGVLDRKVDEMSSYIISNAHMADQVSKVAEVLNVKIKHDAAFDYNYIEVDNVYVFSERYNPEGYKFIKDFFSLSEPEPENDRTVGTEESN